MFRRRLAFMLAFLLAAGCAAAPPSQAPRLAALPLVNGKTTAKQIEAVWGAPASSFEGGRLRCYRITRQGEGFLRDASLVIAPVAMSEASRSVVLVFDAGGVLVRHAIVNVQ